MLQRVPLQSVQILATKIKQQLLITQTRKIKRNAREIFFPACVMTKSQEDTIHKKSAESFTVRTMHARSKNLAQKWRVLHLRTWTIRIINNLRPLCHAPVLAVIFVPKCAIVATHSLKGSGSPPVCHPRRADIAIFTCPREENSSRRKKSSI